MFDRPPPTAWDPPSAARGTPHLELLEHDYSDEFNELLRLRVGDSWLDLHGNGPKSRMARFENTTMAELELHCGPLAHRRVLDFGCGTGTLTPSLASRAEEVVAFDINEPSTEICRRRLDEHGTKNVKIVRADDFDTIADGVGTFDVVFMHAVLEHVPASEPGGRQKVLAGAFESLKPGGYLFITESPNRLWPRDIYCTGLWFLPWTRPGSPRSYRRAIARGCHSDEQGAGPISLEGRGAWGFTYFDVLRFLRGKGIEVVNRQPGHDRWVHYGRRLSARRRLAETVIYFGATRTVGVPVVAFAPMLSPLVIRRGV